MTMPSRPATRPIAPWRPTWSRRTQRRRGWPPPRQQCDHCGCWLPEDVGAWVVAEFEGAILLLCSRECDAQVSALRR